MNMYNGRPKFIMMCGLPGSGKSTYVDNFMSNAEGFTAVLSSDNYIEEKARESNKTYDEIFSFKLVDEAEKHIKAKFYAAIKTGENIIWDQTNLTVKSRAKKLNLVPKDYVKIAVAFSINNRDEWIRRLNSRAEKTIHPSHLEKMMESYQLPSYEEGFDKIFNITL